MSVGDGKKENDLENLLKKIRESRPEPAEIPGKDIAEDTTPKTHSTPDRAASGDFSALLKKLGMEKNPSPEDVQTPVESRDTVLPSPQILPTKPEEVPAHKIESLEDLFEERPAKGITAAPSDTSSVTPGPTAVPQEEKTHQAPETLEEPAPEKIAVPDEIPEPVPEPLPGTEPEIVNEDPRETPAKTFFNRQNGRGNAADLAPVTEKDEHIVSADQVKDLSGLILPKGATFRIEEFRLHGRVNAYETTGIGKVPDELDSIWKKEFSLEGVKNLDLESDRGAASAGADGAVGRKKGFAALFSAIHSEIVEYDPKIHGPLVDLTFTPSPGIQEMEMYPVNEPFAYVRIIYDHASHEYTYQVIEPVLTGPEADLFSEIKERLFETLDINTKDITKDEARKQLRKAVDDILGDYGIKLTPAQREKILYSMHKEFLGNGLIDAVMHDKYIEDISCDGIDTPIFAFHANYESMKTTLVYHTAIDLDSFVTKLAQRAGKYISIAEPILDATMQDGSRIQMTLGHEVTAHGSTFTIRKFKDEPITPTDLIEWHTFAPLSIAYIWLAVENGKSAIFAGGTASGKTTALNAISLFIPPMAKIVSLEDTREVKLPHPNWIPSITRDSFDTAGRGEINMYELLRAAMRQRPEYIIVGEVRGKECQTLFQAMSTGHVTYSTTHADSVASVVHRIENPPMDVPRNMLSALDFICIQVQARVGGKRIRRNKQIVEILDIDPRTNELITNEVFKWKSATDEIVYSGKSYLLEEIMEARGWSENRMREELKRRQEVLEWMRIKKIRHYKDVAKVLISYYREPEVVIERVRKDLYE
jgi:flagellar protein FlaI